LAVAVDPEGGAFVAGQTFGTLPGQSSSDLDDAFIAKLDSMGTVLWIYQLGSEGGEQATGVAVDPAGNLALAGHTWGTLQGQTSSGGWDAFLRLLVP
jgi:hypothetical protein